MNTLTLVLGVVGLAVGAAVGYVVRNQKANQAASGVEADAKRALEAAHLKAKSIEVEGKDRAATLVRDAEKQITERTAPLAALEGRLLKREETLDQKEKTLSQETASLESGRTDLQKKEEEYATRQAGLMKELERISGLSADKAKDELLRQIRSSQQEELALSVQKLFKERHEEVEKQGMEIMTTALQRFARSHVAEVTTTHFHIKDEDSKGKIIGREGRNIRALERATGVEFVVDEAPDSILISSFDPLRREVARLALEKLLKDGRIQPAKIEEKVEEAKGELDKRMIEIGDAAALEVGVYDLPKELIKLLGRLHFRTSFGQNVLTHSIEMSHISGMIAADLGLNVMVAKKGALLHDIGKAIDHEVEGTHVEIGRKLLKKYEVDESVIEAMQSHHDEYPYARPEAYVVTAADVLSAGRPGARRGTLENYIKRLGDLEKIAKEFPGVQSAYALSAGRELRIFVIPEKIDDFRALELAREIANKIQSEMKYPGEIKVNVIREMRAVEYAR
jgi:ribonuclease Y